MTDALPPSGRKADKQIFLTPRRGQKNLSRKIEISLFKIDVSFFKFLVKFIFQKEVYIFLFSDLCL